MENIFLDITVIICIAAGLSIIFKLLKQPEILAYILTGIVIAPFHFFGVSSQPILVALSQIGITLLLFMVGLEIRISELFSMGKAIIISSIGQIAATLIFGFLLSFVLGFNLITAFYISAALTFSSTIIVVKLLSDQRELHSLHGKFSLGILLAQDLLAILILMVLSSFTQHKEGVSLYNVYEVFVKASFLFIGITYLSTYIFPKTVDKIAKSSETLFLASLAWVFGLAAFVSSKFVGFSIEIGGFLAGVSLANSFVNYQIIAKAKILRDFFIIIFFVLLGIQISFANIGEILLPAILLSLFVLTVKPLIVMIILGVMGYRKRTSFLTGVSLSQVSEFSLILTFMAFSLGHIDQKTVSLITLVGLITFATSTYLITHWKTLYRKLEGSLDLIERKNLKKVEGESEEVLENLNDHVVVVGGDQMGQSILEVLEDLKTNVVLIDFDPSIVKKLEGRNVLRLFGDISDLDIQQRAKIEKAKLVISTIPDIHDNLLLLQELKHENRKAKIVMMALEGKEANMLYKQGADYVILPHLAGGRQVAKILSEGDLGKLETLKDKDRRYLN